MLIHDDHIKQKTLDTIVSAKNCSYYRVLPTGELQINHYFKCHVFLAYVRGQWFASYGERKGSSAAVPEEGIGLFACTNNNIWLPCDNNNVDISSSVIPLDESTHAVLFAFSGKAYDVLIADGSKCGTMIKTNLAKSSENISFLVMALTALIRQYDDKAADDILKFWFPKKFSDNSEKSSSNPIIEWQKNKITKESQ